MTNHSTPFELFDLSGRIAIVTGGAGLLGTEFCRTLAGAGAKVVVADIDFAAASNTAEQILDDGEEASAVSLDVTNPISVENLLDAVLDQFGHLDILVNSAALDPKFDRSHEPNSQHPFDDSAFENFPLKAWNQALEVNLTGAFLCSQAAAKPMLKQNSGVIINLSSIYGLSGPDQRMYQQPGKPARYKPVYYSVTKWGILGLTQYLSTYFAGKHIRVNALSPGGVFNDHDDTFVKAYSAKTVLGRMAQKDDLNGALLFLASDASAYMTGANLIVDGGWTAW